jgi:hypothetical protein
LPGLAEFGAPAGDFLIPLRRGVPDAGLRQRAGLELPTSGHITPMALRRLSPLQLCRELADAPARASAAAAVAHSVPRVLRREQAKTPQTPAMLGFEPRIAAAPMREHHVGTLGEPAGDGRGL